VARTRDENHGPEYRTLLISVRKLGLWEVIAIASGWMGNYAFPPSGSSHWYIVF